MVPPTMRMRLVITRAALLLATMGACSAATKDIDKGKAGGAYTFKLGETVKLECKDWETGRWGKGPICKETGEEFAITFGYNNFVYCGMEIKDKKFYDHLVQIIKLEKTWQCRIPMNKKKDFFVPFTIPLWGVVEPDHVHIDNHLNYVLHVDKGNIVAATAYPVHDRFQFGRAGSLISMHGPVRFFDRGSYQSLAGSGVAHVTGGEGSFSPTVAIALCSLTSAVTLFAAAVMYQRRLKPRLIKKLLKDK